MKTKAQKQKDLEALTEQFKNAKAAMLVGFQKMTVAKDQELSNQLREAGVSYEVVKNTLARRASEGTALEPAAVGQRPEPLAPVRARARTNELDARERWPMIASEEAWSGCGLPWAGVRWVLAPGVGA